MVKSRTVCAFLLTVVVLSACAPASSGPGGGSAGVRAWFDAPLPETVFYPPNPCQIVAHGASPAGIAAFELEVNGGAAMTVPSPDTASSLATLTRDCGLTEPGRYVLRMRAQDNAGNWSGYAETSLIIEGRAAPNAPPAPTQRPQVLPSPTIRPTTAAPGGVSIESISTDQVYAGDDSCGPVDVRIVARATAPGSIQVVVLFYRFEPGSPGGFESMAMSPLGGDLYQATINPSSVLGGPADATLQYQVVVQQAGGDTTIRTPVLADIAVQPCGPERVDCSSFTDRAACGANGCRWVESAGPGSAFVCRNP